MPRCRPSAGRTATRRGMTLPETMIVLSLSGGVIATVMAIFLWTGRQAGLCAKIASSQAEAMHAGSKIEAYLRNAAEIVACDETDGTWIQVRFPDDSVGTLRDDNNAGGLRNGRLLLTRDGQTELLVARGLTRIMDPLGGTLPLFSRMGSQGIRVAYRVSDPSHIGLQAANDESYAVIADFAVVLRNNE